MDENETRKLQKLLQLNQEEAYHVFCMALVMQIFAGSEDDAGHMEMLTRIGLGLGLKPKDIEVVSRSAREAIKETSISDVLAFSITRLKQVLNEEQLQGVLMVLEYMAGLTAKKKDAENDVLEIAKQTWFETKKK